MASTAKRTRSRHGEERPVGEDRLDPRQRRKGRVSGKFGDVRIGSIASFWALSPDVRSYPISARLTSCQNGREVAEVTASSRCGAGGYADFFARNERLTQRWRGANARASNRKHRTSGSAPSKQATYSDWLFGWQLRRAIVRCCFACELVRHPVCCCVRARLCSPPVADIRQI